MSLLHMKIIKKKENKRKTRLMKNIEKYKDIVLKNLNACDIDSLLPKKFINGYCKGFNCEGCGERVLKWLLEEAKEPVLDDVEKKYFSAVIKPFRKIIVTVSKHRLNNDLEYIAIRVKSLKEDKEENMCFPAFKIGTMYKGMELDKKYSLEELGL